MTEITPERSAVLLADASRILRRKLDAWPEELPSSWLAALLAGADRGEQFKDWHNRIMRAIEAGHLTARTETIETIKQGRTIDIGERTAFAGIAARVVFQEPAKTVVHTLHHISTAPAASWLHATGLPFPDTVRAWLGPAWQEEDGTLASIQRNSESGGGELATTAEVRAAFALAAGKHFDKFKRALEDAPRWIKSARRDPAGNSKSAGYLWNVAELAEAITEHYELNRKAVATAIDAARWPNAVELYGL
jgi:hypothetical protein